MIVEREKEDTKNLLDEVVKWQNICKVQEEQIKELFLKLESAEKDKQEILEAYSHLDQLLKQLAEEKFGGNWDGEIIFSHMKGMTKDMTAVFIRYDLYQEIKQERDNLQVANDVLQAALAKLSAERIEKK